jgi:hypothetical protein
LKGRGHNVTSNLIRVIQDLGRIGINTFENAQRMERPAGVGVENTSTFAFSGAFQLKLSTKLKDIRYVHFDHDSVRMLDDHWKYKPVEQTYGTCPETN